MSPSEAWPFVIAAYLVAVGGTLTLVGWSLAALRRTERRTDALGVEERVEARGRR